MTITLRKGSRALGVPEAGEVAEKCVEQSWVPDQGAKAYAGADS